MLIKKRYNYSSSSEIFPRETKGLDPFKLFEKCFELASESIPEPNQMVLSTASKRGVPSSRVVLLKEFNEVGFYFYTHYTSQKGREIEENPNVALNFYWDQIKIQVRIAGQAEKIGEAKSAEYFSSRPVLSQLGASLSKQSLVLEDYEKFVEEFASEKEVYENGLSGAVEKKAKPIIKPIIKPITEPIIKLTKPKDWGGYIVIPNRFEFWRGRENRLHERINFLREEGKGELKGKWEVHHLYP